MAAANTAAFLGRRTKQRAMTASRTLKKSNR